MFMYEVFLEKKRLTYNKVWLSEDAIYFVYSTYLRYKLKIVNT